MQQTKSNLLDLGFARYMWQGKFKKKNYIHRNTDILPTFQKKKKQQICASVKCNIPALSSSTPQAILRMNYMVSTRGRFL